MNSNKTIILSSLVAFSAFAHVENTDIESVFLDMDERHSNNKNFSQIARHAAPAELFALQDIVCAEETVLTPFLHDRGYDSLSNSDTRLYLELSELSTCDLINETDKKYFADLDQALSEAGKLKVNWDNDNGRPPALNAIHDVRRFLTFLKYSTQISPVPDGSINISKIFGDNLFDVEFDGTGFASVFFGADPRNPLLMEVMHINESTASKIKFFISQA